jgi:3-amino-5-hydroxybenzoate synthase
LLSAQSITESAQLGNDITGRKISNTGEIKRMETLAVRDRELGKRKEFADWPQYDEREIAAVSRVVESRKWWRMAGTEVNEFEREFAACQGAQRSLAVTNGTQAIEIALAALDIGRGDEVIVPAFSFISTATAVLCANAVPIFVDVKPDTYCMDAGAIAGAITPRTRAIIPVHMAGHSADMDAILSVARKNGLPVIEDAAHGHGAEWGGKRVGAFDIGGIFSFQAGKLMTAGEGGLVLSNDEAFVERCFLFGNCGRPKTDRTYQHCVLGSNSRMSELHAAVLRVQLQRLEEQNETRHKNGALLDRMMSSLPGITPQAQDVRVTRNPRYMYMFKYDKEVFNELSRESFVDALIAEDIPAFVAYLAIHRTPVFRQRAFAPRWRSDDSLLPDYNQVHCPVSELIGETVVWLHHRVLLGDEQDLVRIVEVVDSIRRHATRASGAA